MRKHPSLMFHDLHYKTKKGTQGSISNDEFNKILDIIFEKFNLTMASNMSNLTDREVLSSLFITFDDGLKSQYEIGAKLLNQAGITACFFIHTAPLENDFDVHQILRIFRNSSIFKNVEEFNKLFLDYLFQNINEEKHDEINNLYSKSSYLSQFSFYSNNDRRIRYIRDFHFSHNEYKNLTTDFIKTFNINIDSIIKETYMGEQAILSLHEMGHHIGLHSHSHASNLKSLTEEEQEREVQKNIDILYSITNQKPTTMSYPSNSYSKTTIKVLKSKGIKYAFRADNLVMSKLYELPRIDARIFLDGAR